MNPGDADVDAARGALTAALRGAGPGARGDVFLERVERLTVTLAAGRWHALWRAGEGAALRTWSSGEVLFAAADGPATAALDQVVRGLDLWPAPAAAETTSRTASAPPAPSEAPPPSDSRATDLARYLSGLQRDLKPVAGSGWELAVEETRRHTVVLTEAGVPCPVFWRWVRLRARLLEEAAERPAAWAGGGADLAGLGREWPPARLGPLLQRRRAGAQTQRRQLPRCAPTTPVLLAAGSGALLLHEMAHGLEADAVEARWSAWADGEAGSELLTIWDDPTRAGLRGSYAHDDEGTAADRRCLMRRGRVAGVLADRLRAERDPRLRGGHGRRSSWQEWPRPRASNLCLAAGPDRVDAVTGERGLLLVMHDLASGGTDPRSGEVSIVLSDGEWLDSGRPVAPVAGLTLEGSVRDLVAAVDRVCSERRPDAGAATCGREGEGVPIGFLAPAFRLRGLRENP